MDLKHYRNSIILASSRLKKLLAERDKLDLEIERLGEYIKANANFLPDEERESQVRKLEGMLAAPPGFTDAVRIIMSKHRRYSVTATGVRDLLKKAGYPLGEYSNPLASIHTILKRLEARGEAKSETLNGETYYHWIGDEERVRRNAAFYGQFGGVEDVNDPNNSLYRSGMRDFPKKK